MYRDYAGLSIRIPRVDDDLNLRSGSEDADRRDAILPLPTLGRQSAEILTVANFQAETPPSRQR